MSYLHLIVQFCKRFSFPLIWLQYQSGNITFLVNSCHRWPSAKQRNVSLHKQFQRYFKVPLINTIPVRVQASRRYELLPEILLSFLRARCRVALSLPAMCLLLQSLLTPLHSPVQCRYMGKQQCPPLIGILQAEDIVGTLCVQDNSFCYELQPIEAR